MSGQPFRHFCCILLLTLLASCGLKKNLSLPKASQTTQTQQQKNTDVTTPAPAPGAPEPASPAPLTPATPTISAPANP